MRRSLLLAPALLGACAANASGQGGSDQPTPVHGVTPGHKCQLEGTERFIGQRGTKANGAAIKRASNAAVLRWSPPNTMLTMDYREDRVTVWVDATGKVTKIRCG